jgi:hypothetical protein
MTIHHQYCVAADFLHLFPLKMTRAQILRQARENAFVPFVRTSFKSEPLFLRSDVVNWARSRFAACPELVTEFEDALIPTPAPAKKKARRDARSAN